MNANTLQHIDTSLQTNDITVFVIEDNPIDLRLLEFNLSGNYDSAYRILHAGELISGLQQMESKTIDVVLLDLNLPDSQGIETLEKFKSVYPNLPVVVLTGMDDSATGKEAIRLGAQDYLVKGDFNDSMLRKTIDFSIERQHITKMLYEQDYKYRYIFDNSLDAIFIASRRARSFVNFNVSLQRMLGYERAELFKLNPQDLFVDPDGFKICKESFLNNGFINNQELELYTKSGRIIHILLNINDVRDLNQVTIGLQGIVKDITSLKIQKQKLQELNQELEAKVVKRTQELFEAKKKVEEKNRLVESSIDYAQNIQNALLPSMGEVRNLVDNSFLIFKPRDIVSGDFYWINKVGNKVIFIIGDCTGHGVPGAFMSFIGVQQLNEIICEQRQTDPSKILFELNHRVNRLLKKHDKPTHPIHEGMDIGVCCFNFSNGTLEFASARRPLYVSRENEFWEIKGTNKSIGEENNVIFENKKILLNSEDRVFLFTDGYADQIGGKFNKKFMSRRFRELLQEISLETPERQKLILESTFEEWKGSEMQIDDICGFGITIP